MKNARVGSGSGKRRTDAYRSSNDKNESDAPRCSFVLFFRWFLRPTRSRRRHLSWARSDRIDRRRNAKSRWKTNKQTNKRRSLECVRSRWTSRGTANNNNSSNSQKRIPRGPAEYLWIQKKMIINETTRTPWKKETQSRDGRIESLLSEKRKEK